MKEAKFRKIKELLAAQGWSYNAYAEEFETAGGSCVDWEELLLAIPSLSYNDIRAYEEHYARRVRRRIHLHAATY